MKTKIGIADAHGIESYLDKIGNEKQFNVLTIRANFNRQRHAVVYEITIRDKDDKEINKLVQSNKFIEALKYLKEHAKNIKLASSGMGNIEKSWSLIPNPDLDPYN